MARFTIKTRDAGELEFWCNDSGGYVRVESIGKPGTLGRQICHGGGYSGNTISANAETLAKAARRWNAQRRAAVRELGF